MAKEFKSEKENSKIVLELVTWSGVAQGIMTKKT